MFDMYLILLMMSFKVTVPVLLFCLTERKHSYFITLKIKVSLSDSRGLNLSLINFALTGDSMHFVSVNPWESLDLWRD